MQHVEGLRESEAGPMPQEGVGLEARGLDLRGFAPLEMPPSKVRRSVPPELAYAVSLERLYWSLHIKGLGADAVTAMPRAQRLAVRFAKGAIGSDSVASKDISLRAALSQIDSLSTGPSLVPGPADARQRAQAFERWMTGEVADTVMWCLLRPPVKTPAHSLSHAAGHVAAGSAAKAAAQIANADLAVSDQFMTAVVVRALDVVHSLCAQQTYLFGETLSHADITAAAVLAPVVRKQGWMWAGRLWTPLSAVAGRSALARHPAANWVRMMYDLHTPHVMAAPEQTRAWVP